jgi:hypothetical protein
VGFDARRMFGVDLVVDQTVQENLSFVAVHFFLPSAASYARSAQPRPELKAAGAQAGRAPAWGPGGQPIADIALPTRSGRLLDLINAGPGLRP